MAKAKTRGNLRYTHASVIRVVVLGWTLRRGRTPQSVGRCLR